MQGMKVTVTMFSFQGSWISPHDVQERASAVTYILIWSPALWMVGSPQQVVGVSEQEEEDGDGEPVRDDAPLGQHPLQQARAPHHHAGRQGQPLVVGDVVEVAPAHGLE